MYMYYSMYLDDTQARVEIHTCIYDLEWYDMLMYLVETYDDMMYSRVYLVEIYKWL